MAKNGHSGVRRVLWWLVLSLLLAVAGREVPELLNLADDLSNDGTVVSWVCQAAPQVSVRRAAAHEKLCYAPSPASHLQHLRSTSSMTLLPRTSGQYLLRLFSIRRT